MKSRSSDSLVRVSSDRSITLVARNVYIEGVPYTDARSVAITSSIEDVFSLSLSPSPPARLYLDRFFSSFLYAAFLYEKKYKAALGKARR